MDKTKKYHID